MKSSDDAQHENSDCNYSSTVLDPRYQSHFFISIIFDYLTSTGLILCFVCLFFLFVHTGILPNQHVKQAPGAVIANISNEVTLSCKHNINGYYTVLWYHRPAGKTSLNIVGYVSYTKVFVVEDSYKSLYKVSGNGNSEAFLYLCEIRDRSVSGDYFCAATHCDGKAPNSATKTLHTCI